MRHRERHRPARIGWLRAAVLGANDGIVSTASLIVGVAAAGTPDGQILIAGIAGLVAGAMSMAAGEYVSVSSQADTERPTWRASARSWRPTRVRAATSWRTSTSSAVCEPALARQVAEQLMAHDALGAHARDELGISDVTAARPHPGGAGVGGDLRASARRCRCWSRSWRRPLCMVALVTRGVARRPGDAGCASPRAPAAPTVGPRCASPSGARSPWRSLRRRRLFGAVV